MNTTLVLGGARSGKSRYAEMLAQASGLAVTVVATATAHDDEMRARIARHRAERPSHWCTAEEPRHLATCLRAHAAADRCIVVDCLTLWLSNLLCGGDMRLVLRERKALLEAMAAMPGRLIMVGNETGLGIVPLGALTRHYVDEAGRLHQVLAAHCDRVVMTIAGLPLTLKGEPA